MSNIDDFIRHEIVSEAAKAFDTLHNQLLELGFKMTKKKLVAPITKAVCLGVEISIEAFQVSIPEEKLEQIKELCADWTTRKSCSKPHIQSLLGRLMYISKRGHSLRPFLNQMLEILRPADKQNFTTLTLDFHSDLAWFQKSSLSLMATLSSRTIRQMVKLSWIPL